MTAPTMCQKALQIDITGRAEVPLSRWLGAAQRNWRDFFCYNEHQELNVSDKERMEKSIGGIVGKRLTYRRTGGADESATG